MFRSEQRMWSGLKCRVGVWMVVIVVKYCVIMWLFVCAGRVWWWDIMWIDV